MYNKENQFPAINSHNHKYSNIGVGLMKRIFFMLLINRFAFGIMKRTKLQHYLTLIHN